ncbi:hypothetical protein J2W45_000838 [Leifsonia shinshuensis]|nr:hypothetical protein [Leifsonia shinshuensis]
MNPLISQPAAATAVAPSAAGRLEVVGALSAGAR